ncbi:hypothetical protein ACSS6W_004840 [Trichoderma asperelloides]
MPQQHTGLGVFYFTLVIAVVEEFLETLLFSLMPIRIHGSVAESPGQVPAQHQSRRVHGPM